MSYSDKLLRGIPNKGYIDEQGYVTLQAFQFEECGRTDGFCEASINWYDNEESMMLILNQRREKDDSLQFRAGVAVLNKSWLDDGMKRPIMSFVVNYERAPIEGNKHHGNILMKRDLPKPQRAMIASYLAMGCDHINNTQALDEDIKR